MKNLKITVFVGICAFWASQAQALTNILDLDGTAEKNLAVALSNPTKGCDDLGQPGRLLAGLKERNKRLSCCLCGQEWRRTGDHPNALEAVCGKSKKK